VALKIKASFEGNWKPSAVKAVRIQKDISFNKERASGVSLTAPAKVLHINVESGALLYFKC